MCAQQRGSSSIRERERKREREREREGKNVLVDVAPNTCGCELGIVNRSTKIVSG